jgi:GNAT superfamily N-acetyltransferase
MFTLNVTKAKKLIKRNFPFISNIRNSKPVDAVFDHLAGISQRYKAILELIKLIGLGKFIMRLLYSRQEEIALEINLDEVARFPLKDSLNVYSIERKHVPELALFRAQAGIGGDNPAAGLEEYLDHGFNGFLAELEGRIIGYLWWGNSTSDFYIYPQGCGYYTREIVKMGLTNTFSFDYYLAPQHRGKGIAFEFMANCFYQLRDLGYKINYGYVHSDNVAARWIYKIIGFKEIKRIIMRRLFLFFLFKNTRYYFDDGIKWLFDTKDIYVR